MFTSPVSPNYTKAATSFALATLAVVTLLAPLSAQARGQQPAAGLTVSSLGSDVVKMGEYNGNTYLFKHAGGNGVGSIFKVASSSPNGVVTGIGIIAKGQYFITEPASKSDFFMAVDGRPASFFAGLSASNQAPGATQPINAPMPPPAAEAPSGTVVMKDGRPEVTLAPSGDTVDFKVGGEILIRNSAGQTEAKLTYNGTTADQNAAQKAKRSLGIASRLAALGTLNIYHNGTLNPDNYTIEYDLARGRGGSTNTELYSPRVRTEADPVFRAAARTVEALDIVRKTIPNFSIPAENKLRNLTHDPSLLGVAR